MVVGVLWVQDVLAHALATLLVVGGDFGGSLKVEACRAGHMVCPWPNKRAKRGSFSAKVSSVTRVTPPSPSAVTSVTISRRWRKRRMRLLAPSRNKQ